jgi:hypothetical protein
MGTEDLYERDFQSRDFAMQENTCQIQLHLETHIHVGSVNGWRPPESEATIGYLIQTRSLSIGQLLELH